MTNKDLAKIEGFIERYDKLPKTTEFKYKVIWGDATESEKQEAKMVLDEIDEIFIELRAFIRVRFGEDHEYLKHCNYIDFGPTMFGSPIITNDRKRIQSAWRNGMRSFESLLRNMRAEVLMRIEDQPKIQNSMEKINQSTQITNSNVIIGDVSQSDLSKNKNSGMVKEDAPTKKWQKIGVYAAVLLALIALIINYLMNKGII